MTTTEGSSWRRLARQKVSCSNALGSSVASAPSTFRPELRVRRSVAIDEAFVVLATCATACCSSAARVQACGWLSRALVVLSTPRWVEPGGDSADGGIGGLRAARSSPKLGLTLSCRLALQFFRQLAAGRSTRCSGW
jgi:hypothetical protein